MITVTETMFSGFNATVSLRLLKWIAEVQLPGYNAFDYAA